jgi:hypothetical protein
VTNVKESLCIGYALTISENPKPGEVCLLDLSFGSHCGHCFLKNYPSPVESPSKLITGAEPAFAEKKWEFIQPLLNDMSHL